MGVRAWLYQFDAVRDLKDRLRPYMTKPHEFYEVLRTIEPPQLVYDVGAAVGDKTLTILRTFPSVNVVAFEPHPQSFARLRQRTERYGARIALFPVAVSDKNGEAQFHFLSYADASSFYEISPVLRAQGKREQRVTRVKTATLDSVRVPWDSNIDLLKVDVEGAERAVLLGATQTLRRTRHVFVEILDPPRGPDTRHEIPVLLTRAGFRLRKQYDQDYWFSNNDLAASGA